MKHNYQKGNADLGLVIIVLAVLFFIWLLAGGENHKETKEGPFIIPLSDPENPGKTYGPKN